MSGRFFFEKFFLGGRGAVILVIMSFVKIERKHAKIPHYI